MAKTKATKESTAAAVAEPEAAEAVHGVNKMQAIAEAIRELGKHASAADLIGYARQKFGVEVSPGYVSVIKSNLKKQGKTPRKASAESSPANGHANGRRRERTSADSVQLIREVKALAERAGGLHALKELVDVLAE
jgi:hypothetical protein